MTPVWISLCLLSATPSGPLATAEDLVSNLRYADAEKALVAARAQPEHPREALLRILELQGIVAATLNNGPKAKAFFQQLLALDPEHKLPGDQPPRVRTPFYEAKGMASEAKPMELVAEAQQTADGARLEAGLTADPLSLGKKARFHVREVGGAWTVKDVPLTAGRAAHLLGPGKWEWWVAILGDADATLFSRGGDDKPFTAGTGAGSAVAGTATPPGLTPPPTTVKSSGGSRTGPLFWACVAGAGATAIGGTIAGVLSRSANGSVENAAKDGNGVVTGITQKQADALRSAAKTQAIAANVLFGAAGVLAATGVVVFLVSTPSGSVAVSPAAGGVTVSGSF